MMIEETLRAFAAAFEMGIRLAALILVVSIVGAAVIGRVIEGELTGSHAGIALLFVAALLVGVVLLWDTPFLFALFLAAAGLAALWLMVQAAAQRRLVQEMRSAEEARYKATLERDPRNAAAWSALGDLYLEIHRYDDAITCYERAVQLSPTDPTEKRKLKRAQQLKAEAEARGRFCPQCHVPVPLWVVQCPACGFELSAPVWAYLFAAARDKVAMKKVALAFLIALPIASLWVALLVLLPPLGRALLVLFSLAAIIIVVLVELRR
ncbi:MAG: hypothetical protein IMHGJWDQ_001435 [Candidatus Fervidibacter sp.]